MSFIPTLHLVAHPSPAPCPHPPHPSYPSLRLSLSRATHLPTLTRQPRSPSARSIDQQRQGCSIGRPKPLSQAGCQRAKGPPPRFPGCCAVLRLLANACLQRTGPCPPSTPGTLCSVLCAVWPTTRSRTNVLPRSAAATLSFFAPQPRRASSRPWLLFARSHSTGTHPPVVPPASPPPPPASRLLNITPAFALPSTRTGDPLIPQSRAAPAHSSTTTAETYQSPPAHDHGPRIRPCRPPPSLHRSVCAGCFFTLPHRHASPRGQVGLKRQLPDHGPRLYISPHRHCTLSTLRAANLPSYSPVQLQGLGDAGWATYRTAFSLNSVPLLAGCFSKLYMCAA